MDVKKRQSISSKCGSPVQNVSDADQSQSPKIFEGMTSPHRSERPPQNRYHPPQKLRSVNVNPELDEVTVCHCGLVEGIEFQKRTKNMFLRRMREDREDKTLGQAKSQKGEKKIEKDLKYSSSEHTLVMLRIADSNGSSSRQV
jgi:hypothetical protein